MARHSRWEFAAPLIASVVVEVGGAYRRCTRVGFRVPSGRSGSQAVCALCLFSRRHR